MKDKEKYCKCDFCIVWFDGECTQKYALDWIREKYCKKAIKAMIEAFKRGV